MKHRGSSDSEIPADVPGYMAHWHQIRGSTPVDEI